MTAPATIESLEAMLRQLDAAIAAEGNRLSAWHLLGAKIQVARALLSRLDPQAAELVERTPSVRA